MENFEKTLMGRKYYTKDLPALIESNNRLAKALDKQNKLTEKRMAISAKEKLNERNKTK
jgi:hypothetical protein